ASYRRPSKRSPATRTPGRPTDRLEDGLLRGPDEYDLAVLELAALRLVSRQLHGHALAVVAHEVDPHLEAEVDDPLDHRLACRPVRLERQLEVVRTHPCVSEAVHLADERHHELVGRPLVQL